MLNVLSAREILPALTVLLFLPVLQAQEPAEADPVPELPDSSNLLLGGAVVQPPSSLRSSEDIRKIDSSTSGIASWTFQ